MQRPNGRQREDKHDHVSCDVRNTYPSGKKSQIEIARIMKRAKVVQDRARQRHSQPANKKIADDNGNHAVASCSKGPLGEDSKIER